MNFYTQLWQVFDRFGVDVPTEIICKICDKPIDAMDSGYAVEEEDDSTEDQRDDDWFEDSGIACLHVECREGARSTPHDEPDIVEPVEIPEQIVTVQQGDFLVLDGNGLRTLGMGAEVVRVAEGVTQEPTDE